MSRTYVHRPYGVIRHTDRRAVIRHDHRRGECGIETLDDWKQRFGRSAGKLTRFQSNLPCVPELPYWELDRQFRREVPSDFIRFNWTKPARQRSRQGLRAAKREYNTSGEIDIEIEPHQNRHQACWAWW